MVDDAIFDKQYTASVTGGPSGMCNHQNGLTLKVNSFKNSQQVFGGFGIEGAGGFIRQDYPRVCNQRSGYSRPLFLSAGNFIGIPFQDLGETKLHGDRCQASLHLTDISAVQYQWKQNVILEGEGIQQIEILKDEAKVLQYLEQAAQSGYAPAQYALGEKIYQSAQTPEDFQKALDWFGQAAKQNHAGALYMCGIMYMQGQGTQASIPQAIAAFKQAADLGHANAQYVVGQSYWRGIGLRPSKSKALQWLELAKQNGNTQAEALIAEINAGK